MSKIQSVKGMPDILPDTIHQWHYIESTFQQLANSYGYQEIRFPIVESTALFKRAVGEVTDIVEKEMYSFPDRRDESLSLRPEGTAGCVRACVQHALLRETRRLWYQGPMFRYERPQKGRQRQFHQIGIETFGWQTPDIDAELILLSAQLWKQLGVLDSVELQINSLGNSESRAAHRTDLLVFLSQHESELDADSQKRLSTNPLRILDSKNPDTQALLDTAPNLLDYLDDASAQHFVELKSILDQCNVVYTVNPRLVRGLDYYNMTVFEWVTDALGAQGTVCAGGRYDTLVEQLGGSSTPAVGMAMGVERLCLLLDTLNASAKKPTDCDVYVVIEEDAMIRTQAFAAITKLRHAQPDVRYMVHCGGGSIKSQLKKANKRGAQVALLFAGNEMETQQCMVKPLRVDDEQQTCHINDIERTIKQYL
ncbi:MAG: histidine--tRNA ligase [Pseudomonadota bacterium]